MDKQRELTPSQRITNQIDHLNDWRGELIARLRSVILDTIPEISEEWKWDTPVWNYHGLVFSAGVFKDHVKLNFFKGAAIQDPKRLFNAGLDAKSSRAIDFYKGDPLDEGGLKDLILAATTYNRNLARVK